MAGTAFSTLQEVKDFCGITSANNDAVLQLLIDSVEGAFGAFCNRDALLLKTTEELRDGTGSGKMVLVESPLETVNSLTINGRQIPAATDDMSSGYFFKPGGRVLNLRGYAFDAGNRNVRINYNAGYGGFFPLPPEMKMAARMYVSARFKERERAGVSSRSLAGENVTYNSGANEAYGMPASVANILENYLNIVPESGS
jgi:hypothetical protein